MASKIALGTVQFGLDYGITNVRGRIPLEECRTILRKACLEGIDLLDTAYLYGESESVIGRILDDEKIDFRIVSKCPQATGEQMEGYLNQSLERLRRDRLYGYLLHDLTQIKRDPDIWSALQLLKRKGLVEKAGVTVYYPHEILDLLDQGLIPDIIQVPYNVFDRRFEPFLPRLKTHGIEIHVRSIFLQGLLLQDPENLRKDFYSIKQKLLKLRQLAVRAQLPLAVLLLRFALLQPLIDRVVIGVDSVANFTENIAHLDRSVDVQSLQGDLTDIEEHDERIILPMNWS